MKHDNTKDLNAMDKYTREVISAIFTPISDEFMNIKKRDEIIDKINKEIE